MTFFSGANQVRVLSRVVLLGFLTGVCGVSGQEINIPPVASTVAGFTKFPVPRGLCLINVVLDPISNGVFTIRSLVGEQLPPDTKARIWDQATQAYFSETNDATAGWPEGANAHPVVRGLGFWFDVPTGAASNNYQVYFLGKVPTAATTTVDDLRDGNNVVAYGYPQAVYFTNTALVSMLGGASLQIWDPVGQAYVSARGGMGYWDGIATNLVLKPGVAVIYTIVNPPMPTDWLQSKPYSWP